jgi:carbonic anhydrase
MTSVTDLIAGNQTFVSTHFDNELTINPAGDLMVIGCVDPRVDPVKIFGLGQGEAAVIRNVGGRFTPATQATLGLLGKVGQARSVPRAPHDWNLVLLHHTDCGMVDLAAFPELLAIYFGVPPETLPAKAVSDPYESVKVDVELALQALGGDRFFVSGVVYDVATGIAKVVSGPSTARAGR